LPQQYNSELAEFFGILLGDGSVTRYYTRIYLNLIADKGYEKKIIYLIKKLFLDINICLMNRPKRGTKEIQISSKEVSDYLVKVGFIPKIRSVPGWITKRRSFVKATLRGLFDAEGSIGIKYYKSKKGLRIYKQLTFTNSNKNLLTFVENNLKNLGFSPTKNSKRNIYISNNKDIKKYFAMIGTSNPKLEKKMKIK
jgi:hypothetical protein